MTHGSRPAWLRRRHRGATETIIEALSRALTEKDDAAVRRLLDRAVTLVIDSGGHLNTAPVPLNGRSAASSELLALITVRTTAVVASVNGVVPGDWQGIYSISKAAILAMTKAFAKECAPQGIRVNALLPGLTDTKFAGALTRDPAILARALMHVPMNRVAEPAEMAGALLFLASPASSYTTGTWLNVDGGYLTV